MKPGYQTTEFWLTLLSQILALCVLLGWINVGDKDRLETALTNTVTAAFTFAASASVVWQYLQSRTRLKLHSPGDDKAPREAAPMVLPFGLVLLVLGL